VTRTVWSLLILVGVAVSARPAAAGSLCRIAVPGADGLAQSTADASSRFLEAAGHALLALGLLEAGGEGLDTHVSAAVRLLDEAIQAYRGALARAPELVEADRFLRQRPFERLERIFGITRGTLSHQRWELIAKTARQSPHATRDLIGVCVSGAEQLKYVTSSLKPELPPAQRRRAASTWYLVLSHGHLVSDALDASYE
jgi:hypothetical protein